MAREYRLGSISGVRLNAQPLAVGASLVLLVVFTAIGITLLKLPVGAALIGALAAVVLHWLSVVIHDLGHGWAARRVGYPMSGITLGHLGVLATCIYPPNEPRLPARVHIQRAFGGPLNSLVVSLFAAGIALVLRNASPLLAALSAWFFLDNFLVLTVGSFIPLGFTDGSTLLEWRNKP